jgi:glutaredoxin-related protein
VFVLAAWTEKKLKGYSKSQAIENHRVLEGRRAVEIFGKGCRKRPLCSVVSRLSQEIHHSKRARRENLVSSVLQDDNSHRKLRNRTIVN